MRVVSMGVMLGLGLALGLPQHKEYKEEESPHNELKQGSNLYNEGPNQDSVVNQVEQEPQFDAVKACQDDEPPFCENTHKHNPTVCDGAYFQNKCKKTCNKCPQTPATVTDNELEESYWLEPELSYSINVIKRSVE